MRFSGPRNRHFGKIQGPEKSKDGAHTLSRKSVAAAHQGKPSLTLSSGAGLLAPVPGLRSYTVDEGGLGTPLGLFYWNSHKSKVTTYDF